MSADFDAGRAARALPAIVLLAVLCVLPIEAWTRVVRSEVTFRNASPDMESITWAGTVGPDGSLAVEITYRFKDDAERLADVRIPENSAFAEVDGKPLALSIGRYAEDVPVGSTATLRYTRRDAVTRFSDGVVVDLTDRDRNGGALLECPRCYLSDVEYGNGALYAALFAEGAERGRVAVTGVGRWRTGSDTAAGTGALRFAGEHEGIATAMMVALLPPEAAPGAPLADGSASERYDAIRAELDVVGSLTSEPGRALPVGRTIGALIVTVLVGALAGWVAWRVVQARRRLAADLAELEPAPLPDAPFAPPSKLEPALVALLVGAAGPGRRSAVAATLLMLAHRGVILIDGVDSQRFALRLPPGARGASRFEEAVLHELRPQGNADAAATLTGPPLWGADGRKLARKLAFVLFREARSQKLHRMTLAPAVLVPATFGIGLAAVVVSAGQSTLAWVVLIAGTLLALAAAGLTGITLTGKGLTERQRWLRYGAWLRAHSELERVGAPAVATWGEILAYAAAVGAAPTAAAALSPRR